MTILNRIRHAGSIFLGPWATVPVGDYASGTNHVLPTGGGARAFSGLSVDDFVKRPTFQYLSREGLASLGGTVRTLARAAPLAADRGPAAGRAAGRLRRRAQAARAGGRGLAPGARVPLAHPL